MLRAYIVVGLGFGDECKGACVDYLCRKVNAGLVVRYCGGSQCGHNVQLPDGRRHTFSQFGSGTLAGVKTHLGPNVIIYPEALRNEAKHLTELGVKQPYDMLTVDPSCLVTTVYHRAVNRIREMARGKNKHGSCGHGIGETRSYWLKYGQDSIFAKDLGCSYLKDKLELMRQRYLLEISDKAPNSVHHQIFNDSAFTQANKLCSFGFMREPMQCWRSPVIFEGAQGVLLDEWHGFHPYTTWSTVTTHHAHELIALATHKMPKIEVTTIGCTRPYTTRHGAGPLPGEDADLTKHVNDIGNPWNEWQENFRAGWLNMPLLHYAAKVVGKIDFLSVSCMDHLEGIKPKICRQYIVKTGDTHYPMDLEQTHRSIAIMEANTKKLETAEVILGEVSKCELGEELSKIAPVAIVSEGPTWEHRTELKDIR